MGGNPLFTESHPMQSQVGFSMKFLFVFLTVWVDFM